MPGRVRGLLRAKSVGSDEPRQVVGELGPPGGPVVGDVVAPQVGLVGDALLPQQAVEGPGRLEGSGGVLPLALAAEEEQRQAAPQPLEVVAVEVGHIVHRVVEVPGRAAPAPAQPAGVVHAALADAKGEQVGPAEGEAGRVEGPEAGPGDHDVQRALAVVVDEGDHLVEDPVLELAVLDGPVLQGQVGVAPAGRLVAVDRVDLDPAGLDQVGDGVDHAAVLVVGAAALLGLEGEQGARVVAVGEQPALGPDRGRPQPNVVASHHSSWSSPTSQGSKVSRQATQLWASRCSWRATCQPRAARASRTTWLPGRFSSTVPQVRAAEAGSAGPVPAARSSTKRVMRRNRGKPRSWSSTSGRKKLPDWRNRPPKLAGAGLAAARTARAPRLAPIPASQRRPGGVGASAWRAGRTSLTRARDQAGEAE